MMTMTRRMRDAVHPLASGSLVTTMKMRTKGMVLPLGVGGPAMRMRKRMTRKKEATAGVGDN